MVKTAVLELLDCPILIYTVWQFQDFSVTQILSEINFEESKSSKMAILAKLGDLNFVNLVNFSFQKVQKCMKIKFSSSKCAKRAVLDLNNH